MLSWRSWLNGLAVVLMSLLVAAAPARAHPHIFIEARAEVQYENGTFTGIVQRWTFDEYYSSTAIVDLDTNKDGIYDRQELAELAKVNMDGLKEFAYFTTPTLAGKEVKLGEVKEYWLEHKDGLLTLVFKLPFEQPILSDAKDFRFVIADPTFMIGFQWAKPDPVTFSKGAPKSCSAKFGAADKEGDDQALRGALQQQFGAAAVAMDGTVEVHCAP